MARKVSGLSRNGPLVILCIDDDKMVIGQPLVLFLHNCRAKGFYISLLDKEGKNF